MNGSDPLKRRRNAATALVAVATWALVMLLVFRDPLSSGLRLGFGDRADSMIELAILEHWRNVWAGAANWSQTFYFFPYAATLGYNDCYLVSGLFYTVWRIGFDPFLAVLLTAATFRTIAFFRVCGCSRGWCGWRGRALCSRQACSRLPATNICN